MKEIEHTEEHNQCEYLITMLFCPSTFVNHEAGIHGGRGWYGAGYEFEVSKRSLEKHDGNNRQRIASGIPQCETFQGSR